MHIMEIWEDHPTDKELLIKVYAPIQFTEVTGQGWCWQRRDNTGKLGSVSSFFPQEADAKADALSVLQGWKWDS